MLMSQWSWPLPSGFEVSSFYPVVIIIRLIVEKWANICFLKGTTKSDQLIQEDICAKFRGVVQISSDTDGQPENRIKNFWLRCKNAQLYLSFIPAYIWVLFLLLYRGNSSLTAALLSFCFVGHFLQIPSTWATTQVPSLLHPLSGCAISVIPLR